MSLLVLSENFVTKFGCYLIVKFLWCPMVSFKEEEVGQDEIKEITDFEGHGTSYGIHKKPHSILK